MGKLNEIGFLKAQRYRAIAYEALALVPEGEFGKTEPLLLRVAALWRFSAP